MFLPLERQLLKARRMELVKSMSFSYRDIEVECAIKSICCHYLVLVKSSSGSCLRRLVLELQVSLPNAFT